MQVLTEPKAGSHHDAVPWSSRITSHCLTVPCSVNWQIVTWRDTRLCKNRLKLYFCIACTASNQSDARHGNKSTWEYGRKL